MKSQWKWKSDIWQSYHVLAEAVKCEISLETATL